MKRIFTSYIILIAGFFLASLLALLIGSSHFTLSELLAGLTGENERVETVLLYVRLPRLFAALTAGAGLALSGTLLQEVLNNPLAGPNTVGVNAGAGLFAALCLALFPAAARLLPLFAFLGALVALAAVLLIARAMGGVRHSVILGGIACTTLFQSGISFLLVLIPDAFAVYSGFSMGSFFGVSSKDVVLPYFLIALCAALSLVLARRISVLSLGDGVAASLGVRVSPLRITALVLACLSAAAAVSFAGLLGFVGLVVPHIARKMMGSSLHHRLAASLLCGGILTVLADLLGRTLFAPSEIPVGILMAVIGVPCFVAILVGKRREKNA